METNIDMNFTLALEQVGNDRDFLIEVLYDMICETTVAKIEIREAIEKKNFYIINLSSHRIKGSSSYLYCERLTEISFKLQMLGQEGVVSPSVETMDKIKCSFKEFCDTIDDLQVTILQWIDELGV